MQLDPNHHTFLDIKVDDRPGLYYVSVISGSHFALVAGPFATHAEALTQVEPARKVGAEVDTWSTFYKWGTARKEAPEPIDGIPVNPPFGKLNTLLGLKKEGCW